MSLSHYLCKIDVFHHSIDSQESGTGTGLSHNNYLPEGAVPEPVLPIYTILLSVPVSLNTQGSLHHNNNFRMLKTPTTDCLVCGNKHHNTVISFRYSVLFSQCLINGAYCRRFFYCFSVVVLELSFSPHTYFLTFDGMDAHGTYMR